MVSTRNIRPLICLLVATAVLLLGCSFASLLGSSPTSTPTAEPTIATVEPTIATVELTTATVEPTAVPSATVETSCLVGVWEARDVQQFVTSILPASVTALGTPEFKSTTGSLRYTFTQDGQATAEASHYAIHYAISSGILSLPLDVQIDGKIAGSYSTTAPDGLNFTKTSAGQITITASLAGAPLLNTSLGDLIPIFGGQPSGSPQGTYTCSASTFDYTPPVSGAKPIVFQRVSP